MDQPLVQYSQVDSGVSHGGLGISGSSAARVDMSKLEYISSAGLRVLLIMVKRFGPGHVTVTRANELVSSILDQTGYADLLAAE